MKSSLNVTSSNLYSDTKIHPKFIELQLFKINYNKRSIKIYYNRKYLRKGSILRIEITISIQVIISIMKLFWKLNLIPKKKIQNKILEKNNNQNPVDLDFDFEQ